jgi:multisubunit Na+/H+ antiporter MnhE subunit
MFLLNILLALVWIILTGQFTPVNFISCCGWASGWSAHQITSKKYTR